MSQPFTKEIWQQLAGTENLLGSGGYDTFWKEPIVKESDVAGLSKGEKTKVVAKKRFRHIYNTFVPTLAIDIEKGIDSITGKPDYRGRERPEGVVAADVFVGFKMYPVDYAEQMMRQASKLNPKSSRVAQRIHAEIRTLSVKRNFFVEKGLDGRVKDMDKKIADKIRQLQGLGAELKKKGEVFQQIR